MTYRKELQRAKAQLRRQRAHTLAVLADARAVRIMTLYALDASAEAAGRIQRSLIQLNKTIELSHGRHHN